MNPNNFNIFAVEYAAETQFSVDPETGYKALRAEERPFIRTDLELLGESLKSFKLTPSKPLRGAKGGSATIVVRLSGCGTPAGSSAATAENELSPLLMAAGLKPLFADHKQGSQIAAQTEGKTLKLPEGSAEKWNAGAGIASESGELNFVKSVVSNENPNLINCVNNWATQPQIGEEIFNSRTLFPTKNPVDLTELPTFAFRFHAPGFLLKLTGACVANFSIRGNARELLAATLEILFDSFEFASPEQPAPFDDWPQGLKALGAPFFYEEAETPIAGFEFNLNNSTRPRASVTAPNGREGWFIADRKPMLKLASYYSAERCLDWLSGASKSASITVGGESGNLFGIFIPLGDIRINGRPDRGGLVGEDLEIMPIESPEFPADLYLAFA